MSVTGNLIHPRSWALVFVLGLGMAGFARAQAPDPAGYLRVGNIMGESVDGRALQLDDS